MDQKFLFVDGVQIGKTARKQIRRHVMNGKNAGKKVHRRSRLDLIRPTPYYQKQKASGQCEHQIIEQEHQHEHSSKEQHLACPIMNHRSLGNPFLTLSYPVETTSYTINVFNEYFTRVDLESHPTMPSIGGYDLSFRTRLVH
ncbi:hypothetical protein AnigIFM50267_007437 [Aspergillus niger]|nr:hypothetical protein AnigIFM50267_007437 [Aspergillus niger]